MRFLIKIYRFYFFAAFLIGVSAFADDHGDSISEATPIEIGSKTESEIEWSGDVDCFQFTLDKNEKLVWQVTGLYEAEWELLNSAGVVMDSKFIYYDDEDPSILDFPAGIYYIKVSGVQWGGTEYQLYISFI